MGSSWALVPMASRSRFLAMRQLEVPAKASPRPSLHGLDRPVLPEEAVPPPGAEIGDA